MLIINDASLEWALSHLTKYYDSDFFPRLFEFEAIKFDWDRLKKDIMKLDIESYMPKSPRIMYAPKINNTFRVVHQLDPIDSLIYTSLIFEIAQEVEEFRRMVNPEGAFSYHVNIGDQGDLFQGSSSWKDFLDQDAKLREDYSNGFVIVTDITDFYGQIYLHRVENLICEASSGRLQRHGQAIERFLMRLNKGNSRGIPVGPSASIVIAELIMADIDRFLTKYECKFIRYVDDVKIFTHDYAEAIKILQDLTGHLHAFHRLVLSSSKTRLVTVQDYENNFVDEENVEQTAKQSEIDKEIEQIVKSILSDHCYYNVEITDYNDLREEIKDSADLAKNINILGKSYLMLFKQSLEQVSDYSMIRHLLKKASRYKIRSILRLVSSNLERLMPVFRETILYLISVVKESDQYVKRDLKKLLHSPYIKLPYVNMWYSYFFINKRILDSNDNEFLSYVLSLRQRAELQIIQKDTTWIRGYKDKIDDINPWAKRALLYGAGILPKQESKVWIRCCKNSNDLLEKAIVSHVLSKL
ncbi:MAG TPA: RNA-directed DNA polymerase [Fermentimonas sp.]|nr:RNA-directed DNA polymerase [Fermentimonas sp.]